MMKTFYQKPMTEVETVVIETNFLGTGDWQHNTGSGDFSGITIEDGDDLLG